MDSLKNAIKMTLRNIKFENGKKKIINDICEKYSGWKLFEKLSAYETQLIKNNEIKESDFIVNVGCCWKDVIENKCIFNLKCKKDCEKFEDIDSLEIEV